MKLKSIKPVAGNFEPESDLMHQLELLTTQQLAEKWHSEYLAYHKGKDQGISYLIGYFPEVQKQPLLMVQNRKMTKQLLFSDEEIRCIRIDSKHIIEHIDLSQLDASIRKSIVKKIDDFLSPHYEYELFISTDENEIIQMNGWYPISNDRIKHPERIEEYIDNGILRRI